MKHPFVSLLFLLVGVMLALGLTGLVYRWKSTPQYYESSSFNLPPSIPTKAPEDRHIPIKVPILLYHYVEHVKDRKDTMRQKLDIVPEIFEKQVKTLKEASYSALFINDLADILEDKQPLPEKPIVLTFDDGYEDFYTDVFPILKKYQMKATAYIISGVLDKPNYMTKAQVKEVADSGLVEIASHTVHHINLKTASNAVVQKELEESKTALETLIGKPVPNFAYPYGLFTKQTADLVEQAGYRTAASVVAGGFQSLDNRYFLFRLRPGYRNGIDLLSWLEQVKK